MVIVLDRIWARLGREEENILIVLAFCGIYRCVLTRVRLSWWFLILLACFLKLFHFFTVNILDVAILEFHSVHLIDLIASGYFTFVQFVIIEQFSHDCSDGFHHLGF